MKLTKLVSLRLPEQLLLGGFIVLNVVDTFLTIILIQRGYLCLETNLVAERLLTTFGPPYYQFGLLWVYKIGITLSFIIGLIILVKVFPRIRKLAFLLPVCAMAIVCINNLVRFVWF